MQQLGVILTPYGAHSPYGWYAEIAQARGGNGSYLSQSGYPNLDRQFYSRGEPGFYYDSRLGGVEPKTKIGLAIKAWWDRMFGPPAVSSAPAGLLPRGDGMTPTDAELATNVQCYTPVASGWINTQQGYVPGTWRFGWNPAGEYGPPTSLSGLRDAPVQTAADVIGVMSEHNKRMFYLGVVSTTAVSISALFTLWTRWKRMNRELAKRRR